MQLCARASPLRWLMIGLVFWATMINYMDRQALAVLAPVLRDEFHMSNLSYGRIVSAFMLAYTIMNGISGPLIDRLGTRLGYALCVGWWSAAAMLHAAAASPWGFGVCRFLLGMGEAGNWPAGVRVVAEWFPVPERALSLRDLQQRFIDRGFGGDASDRFSDVAVWLAIRLCLGGRNRRTLASGLVADVLRTENERA